MRKKTRVKASRRDRRKAKASEFRRQPTKNPKKVAHHPVEAHLRGTSSGDRKRKTKGRPTRAVHTEATGQQPFAELVTLLEGEESCADETS